MRIKSTLTAGLVALLYVGCQPHTKDVSLTCPDIDGIGQIFGPNSPDIIVIGEIHGMSAPPEFVSALTCQALRAGLSTTLALELSDDNGHIADYLSSDGGDQAKDSLFEDPLWTTGFTDGRSSQAMLSLIDQARLWTSQDLDFQLSAFASGDFDYASFDTRNDAAGAWEEHLAKGILDASVQSDRTIVLVGNLHARRGRNTYGDLDYKLMVGYLPKDKSVTFDTVTTRGTSWSCVGQPVKCGERSAGGPLNSDHPFAQDGLKVVMSEALTDELRESLRFDGREYDGVVFAGRAKASAPANASNRKPFGLE